MARNSEQNQQTGIEEDFYVREFGVTKRGLLLDAAKVTFVAVWLVSLVVWLTGCATAGLLPSLAARDSLEVVFHNTATGSPNENAAAANADTTVLEVRTKAGAGTTAMQDIDLDYSFGSHIKLRTGSAIDTDRKAEALEHSMDATNELARTAVSGVSALLDPAHPFWTLLAPGSLPTQGAR